MKKVNCLIIICLLLVGSVSSQESRFQTILFDIDKFELKQSEINKIESFKKQLNYKNDKIEIIGYTDELGKEGYNNILSNKRAKEVAKYFKEFDVVKSTGLGELNGVNFKNRKVEIKVLLSKGKNKVNDFSDLKKENNITLQNVYFLPGQDYFTGNSNKALNELYEFLKINSEVKIKILGHICCPKTDNPKEDAYNSRTGKKNLSEARAKRVLKYLVAKGINKQRLSYKGMAYTKPLGGEEQFNRRVEISIIE
ncbi:MULTISPECIES: OmpA family protein [unclassified Tenacibaculum]|uniref:OmpA family protein n=1 Tax=unclassified Tenacibaculum TaxID=2635139 RepID=UPI001F487867|nr:MULTISPECIES: OmpA family protein [unclassified Tenacibaculum]MCF2875297.1 OmpA family protein [Tenacibaculum sp. Cn5-1]MCF2935373.1 OmpA family protein [Tenacibaculum sp. Cn5-34]MCG7511933.1 OmpA family protein [Tenacibaculum sp. Cn5-46]